MSKDNEIETNGRVKDLLERLERIQAAGDQDDKMLRFNIKVPYSDARRPSPARWKTDQKA